jgi:1,4-dihydroxy-2-naphthoate octaprenyltransferase
VVAVASAFYGLAAAAGFTIAAVHEPRVLWIGLLGMALAFFYHAPPFKLSYCGLGEIAVALTYGPLIASGTYLVQRHAFWSDSLLPSLPLGALIGAFLLINEFPDHDADRAAGKRTLVVRLGKRRAALLFTQVITAAFAFAAALPALGLPSWTLLGLLPLPLAVRAAQRLSRQAHLTPAIVPAQAWTLQTFVLFAVCVSAGLLLPR